MTHEAVVALRLEREEVLRLYRSLTPEEWEAPSACEGWRVQDVLAHLGSLFHISPSFLLASVRGKPVEVTNDVGVDQRRSRSAAEVLAEYEKWSARSLRMVAANQKRPLAWIPMPLGDLGRHPLHRLADAFLFDHYTHLRYDVVAPWGPIDRPPLPADPLRLTPAIGWMLALFTPLCSDALRWLETTVHLDLTGPGGGDWTIAREVKGVVVTPGKPTASAATVTSATTEFVAWATHRRPWRECDVTIDGDHDIAERTLDGIRVF